MRLVQFSGPDPLLDSFLALPGLLYAGDPRWIAPSREALAAAFSPDSPFFQAGEARHFLALRADRPVGRVTAIRNYRLEAREGPVGLLGFFECEPDAGTSERLLAAAVGHLVAAGLRTVRAPVDFDLWHRSRFMTEGFDESPILLEPYNKPYYPRLFLRFGFREADRSVSTEVTDLPAVLQRLLTGRTSTLARGFAFRSLQGQALTPAVHLLYRLAMEACAGKPGYTEISEQEFLNAYGGLGVRLDPDLVLVAESRDGGPAGFLVGFPNVLPPRSGGNGDLPALNVLTVAVLPPYRGIGLGRALVAEVYRRALHKGYRSAHHCLLREGSPATRLDAGMGRVHKRYALYEITPGDALVP
jgi:GNAT superfamily N-acetyltransferase